MLAVTVIIAVDSLYGVLGGLFGGPEMAPGQRLFLFSLTRPLRALPRHHPLKRSALDPLNPCRHHSPSRAPPNIDVPPWKPLFIYPSLFKLLVLVFCLVFLPVGTRLVCPIALLVQSPSLPEPHPELKFLGNRHGYHSASPS